MKNIAAYYQSAKANIKNPTIEHTKLAINQNLGGISVFNIDLIKALNSSKLSEKEKTKINFCVTFIKA